MAWTKAKTIVVAGVAVLLATGTTMVVIEKIVSPTVDESFWQMNVENLRKAPPVLIIRPTKYYKPYSSSMINNHEGKVIAQNTDVIGLLREAYSGRQFRMISPANVPTNRFDLMLTLPDHQKESLQKAIQRKFGFIAHRETRETDVLVLTVKNPKLLALHAGKRGSKMDFKGDGKGLWAYSNFPISTEAQLLEAPSFKPVILQPGLSGNYDITFQWDYDPQNVDGMQQAISNELAQAGLELVPSREPVEMLVVEKVK